MNITQEQLEAYVSGKERVSIPMLQAEFSLSYVRAKKSIEQLVESNIITFDGGVYYKKTDMFITRLKVKEQTENRRRMIEEQKQRNDEELKRIKEEQLRRQRNAEEDVAEDDDDDDDALHRFIQRLNEEAAEDESEDDDDDDDEGYFCYDDEDDDEYIDGEEEDDEDEDDDGGGNTTIRDILGKRISEREHRSLKGAKQPSFGTSCAELLNNQVFSHQTVDVPDGNEYIGLMHAVFPDGTPVRLRVICVDGTYYYGDCGKTFALLSARNDTDKVKLRRKLRHLGDGFSYVNDEVRLTLPQPDSGIMFYTLYGKILELFKKHYS